MSESADVDGHVFVSYARDDSADADRLVRVLDRAGIPVWLAAAELRPGQDRRAQIREAITSGAVVFLACFSRTSIRRETSHQNDELTLALDQLRQRQFGDSWLIPVRFDDCQIPQRDIGGGRTLANLQRADLFGPDYDQHASRLVETIRRLHRRAGQPASPAPRIVAEDRSSLAARTLQPVARLRLLGKHLDRTGRPRPDDSGQRRALLLIGEGGIGKSVLLGQYLDRLEAAGDRAAVLVSCPSIEPAADLTSLKSADLAFGVATSNPMGREYGLLALMDQLRRAHGEVTLLIDTLDVRISESSLVPFAAVIAEALKTGDVIAACRTQEYRSFLQDGAHRLDGRVDPVTMPSLSEGEIIAWTERYMEASPQLRPAERIAFVNSLRGGVSQSQSLRNVCSLPVRLALTCQTFKDSGHVPPELTVAGLFDRYWDARIAKHGGLGTARAYAKQDAALKLASAIIQRDTGRILLRVPNGRIDADDRPGLELLASEGVVHQQSTYVEFFHQTFAEYAHARWLLSQGVDTPEIAALSGFLAAGQLSLWDVATSLLLQVTDFDDYCYLTKLFPVATVQAARARATAALSRDEPTALSELLTEIGQRADLIPAVIDVLADTSYDRLREAYSWTITALRAHPSRLAKKAGTALASMLPRHERAEIPRALRSALVALIEARQAVDLSMWLTLPERMVLALTGHPAQPDALPVLRELYALLGDNGQQATLRAHLAVLHDLTAAEISQLAEVALGIRCPVLHDEETISLVEIFWNEPSIRASREWASMLDLVRHPLPGRWQTGQVRLAAASAMTDESLRAELFDSAYQGVTGHTENIVNVAKRIAESHPQWCAARLLALERFDQPRIVQAVLAVAQQLVAGATPAQRELLVAQLRADRDVNPRSGYSAEVILAGDRAAEHREIIRAIEQLKPPRAVLNSVLDTWLSRPSPHTRIEIAPDLRRLLSAPDADTMQRRARLEAVLAVSDTSARDWITDQVLRGQSPRVARTAVTSFGRAAAAAELGTGDLEWLTALLPTRHTESARSVAALIKDEQLFGDRALAQATTTVPATAARLRVAVERSESSLLMQTLVQLLVRLNRASPLPIEVVDETFELIRLRLEVPSEDVRLDKHADQFSAVTDLRVFVGQAMTNSLPAQEVRRRVGTVLLGPSDGQVLSNARSSLVVLLKGLGRVDLPNACTWMRDIFTSAGVAPGVQLAIAEAMLDLDGQEPGGRAAALQHESNCPPAVATYLQKNIRR